MPVDPFKIFLRLDGINGGATEAKYKDQIEVLSYEQGVSRGPAAGPGGGAGTGQASFSPVRFRKPLDKSSPELLVACAAGKHQKEALFTFTTTATPAVEFYKVKLSDVLVTALRQTTGTGAQYPLSFDALDTGSSDRGLLDEVALTYAKIQWEYQPIASKGGKRLPPVNGGWDLATNTKL